MAQNPRHEPVTDIASLDALLARKSELGKQISANCYRIGDKRTSPPDRNRIRAENVRLQFELEGVKLRVVDLNNRVTAQVDAWRVADDLDDLPALVAALTRAVKQGVRDGALDNRSEAAMRAAKDFLREFALDTVLSEGGDE